MTRRLNWRLIFMCTICVQLGVVTDMLAEGIGNRLRPHLRSLGNVTVYQQHCAPPHLTDHALNQAKI